MFTVDVPKVRGRMAEKGYTLSSLSEELGINRATLAGYLSNPSKIPYHALNKMALLLCEGPEDAETIFFAQDLRGT